MVKYDFNRAARRVATIVVSLVAGIGITFAATAYAQSTRLTIEATSATIKEVLAEIESRSEFVFFYHDGVISETERVSLKAQNETVDRVLDKLFATTGNTYVIRDRQIFISEARTAGETRHAAAQNPQSQGRTLTGTVVDEAGAPLAGVMLTVTGVKNPAVTSTGGSFTIENVPEGATLTTSYLGYAPQAVAITQYSNLKITLQPESQAIEGVVVVGYGVAKKETLAGAVASIGADQLSTTKTDNVISNMQGKMAGLFIRQNSGEPGAFDSQLSIRGYGEPIVVIDGLVRSREGVQELAQLNSEDIESVSVLKDAAAIIFGMNSANGAIIVTTKKGGKERTRVTYNGMFSLRMPTGMPKMVDALTYRQMANEYKRNIGASPEYDDATLEKFRSGEYKDFNWIDMYLAKSTPSHSHTVSVRGGGEKVRFYTSLGYNEDRGMIKNNINFYRRFTFRGNLSADLGRDFKMNVQFSGRMDTRQRAGEDFIWTYKSLIVNDRGVGPYTLKNPNHLSDVKPESKNPAAITSPDHEGYNRYENLTGNAAIDLTWAPKWAKGLKVNALGSLDYRHENGTKLSRMHEYYNYFSDAYAGKRGENAYESRMTQYKKTYGKIQIDWSGTFGGHTVAATAASEISQDRWDKLTGRRTYKDIPYTFDVIDKGKSSTATNSGDREFRRHAAFLGRVNYDYRGRYIFEAMVRYDGSYRYARAKRWTTYPSVSAAWRISEESFLKDRAQWLDNLKLRASWGQSGRDQGDEFAYMPAYQLSSRRGYIFDEDLIEGAYPPGVVSDNQTWIKAKIFNVGLDITVLKGLDITFEWFQRRNTGMLADRASSVPNTFGASLPKENLNSDLNTGLELDIRYRGQKGAFKYGVGANVSYVRTKRLHVERGPLTSQWDRWRNGDENRYTGRSLIYTWDGRYTSLGDYETAPLAGGERGNSVMLPGAYRIKDNNGDGVINAEDQLFANWSYGNSGYNTGERSQKVNPPLQFGFNVDLTWKWFDLGLLFQGAALYSVNYGMHDIWGYGRYPTLHEKFLDRWHTDGDPLDPASKWIPGKYPAGRPYNYNNTTDSRTINVWRPMASYLRLKNVEIGYTLPKDALRKIRIQSLRVFVNGTNLLLFTKKDLRSVDPERQEGEWDAGLSYPIMKAVNFGVNISF